jgi:hypothetical protein
MGTYGIDNKPDYIQPLLEKYNDIEFESCGSLKGSWVKILVNGEIVKLEREITNNIEITGYYEGKILTNVNSGDYNNVKERNELIGDSIMERLSGYHSGEEAFEDNF